VRDRARSLRRMASLVLVWARPRSRPSSSKTPCTTPPCCARSPSRMCSVPSWFDLLRRTTALAMSRTSRAFWESLFRSTRRLLPSYEYFSTAGIHGEADGDERREQQEEWKVAVQDGLHQARDEGCGDRNAGDCHRERPAVAPPGAVDERPCPISCQSREYETTEADLWQYEIDDKGSEERDRYSCEEGLGDLVPLHDAGPCAAGEPGVVGAFDPDLGLDHAFRADGPPTGGARDPGFPVRMPVATHCLGHQNSSRPRTPRANSPRGIRTSSRL